MINSSRSLLHDHHVVEIRVDFGAAAGRAHGNLQLVAPIVGQGQTGTSGRLSLRGEAGEMVADLL